jgi:hypothetical protein
VRWNHRGLCFGITIQKLASELFDVIDSISVAGHAKGGLHYAFGQNEKGAVAMKSASRTAAVVAGGAVGFAAAGPVGAVGGAIAGGIAIFEQWFGSFTAATACELLY